jgi:hypothetical protein
MMLRSSLVALTVFAVGCSSSGGSSPAPAGNQGVVGPGETTGQAVDKNPYGVAYPTQNLGYDQRVGNRPGNILRNLRFQGYKTTQGTAVEPSGKLESISLADLFDPELKNGFKVLHITVSSVWCTPCNEETKEMVSVAPDAATKSVLFFQALADGPAVGTGATLDDLDSWVTDHKVNFMQVLDPSLKALGPLFTAGAVPFNANIDLRSMEILSAAAGAPNDLVADGEKWVKWVDSHPAQGAQ